MRLAGRPYYRAKRAAQSGRHKWRAPMSSNFASRLARVEPDRYISALYAPPEARRALLALYAFDAELTKARRVATEPLIGEIRLQWWREAIGDLDAGNVRRHEILEALAAVRASWSAGTLQALIDAHSQLLDDAVAPSADVRMSRLSDKGARVTSAAMLVLHAAPSAELEGLAAAAGAAYELSRELFLLSMRQPVAAKRNNPGAASSGSAATAAATTFVGGETEKKPEFLKIERRIRHAMDEVRKHASQAPVEMAPTYLHAALSPVYVKLAKARLGGARVVDIGPLRRRLTLMRAAFLGKV